MKLKNKKIITLCVLKSNKAKRGNGKIKLRFSYLLKVLSWFYLFIVESSTNDRIKVWWTGIRNIVISIVSNMNASIFKKSQDVNLILFYVVVDNHTLQGEKPLQWREYNIELYL